MLEIIFDNPAPTMFVCMILALCAGGCAVAFSLALVGFVFGTIPDRVFGRMSNETLLAIPFFTFMGIVLEPSGVAEKMLDAIGRLFMQTSFMHPPFGFALFCLRSVAPSGPTGTR